MIKFDGITEDKNCIGEDVLKYEKKIRDLPEELNYVEISNGYAVIQPNSDVELRFNCEINDELNEKIEGDIANLDEYMYNSQKPLPIEKVYVGNRELPKESILIAPFKDVEFKEIFITSSKFSKDDYWEAYVRIGKKKLKVKFIRGAYDGIKVKRYIGEVDKGFKIILEFSENGKFRGEVKFNISKLKSINDVLKIGEYLSNIRTLKINEFKLGAMFNKLDNELSGVIEFWRKVKEIGKILKKRFSYRNKISTSDVKNVNDLYKCLVEKKFCNDKKSTIYLTFKDKLSGIENLSINKAFCLIAVSESEFEVLGKTIKVFTECIFLNYKFTGDIEELDDGIENEISIQPSENSCILERFFDNEDERNKFHSKITSNSKTLNEIINEFVTV